MRVYLDQIGCRLNYSEMDALASQLHAAGHQPVAAPEHAQVVVFNTCAVTREAGSKSGQRIRQLHRANPAARDCGDGVLVHTDARAGRSTARRGAGRRQRTEGSAACAARVVERRTG